MAAVDDDVIVAFGDIMQSVEGSGSGGGHCFANA